MPDTAKPAARPLSDGSVESERLLHFPFMAPRLQGDLLPDGKLSLSVWGCGHIANLYLETPRGPFVYSPNSVVGDGFSLHVAQSAPVALLHGTQIRRLMPARRCAWWGTISRGQKIVRHKGRRIVSTDWGHVIVEARGQSDILVAAGETLEEAERGLALAPEDIRREAQDYCRRTDILPKAGPLARSMAMQACHAALSSIRLDDKGNFLGLAAGQAYSAPSRTYYRDGYWTLQALLVLEPQAVAAQIDRLAQGIQPDGEAPSGVILTGPAQAAEWERFRSSGYDDKMQHRRTGDWWSDHFDSPLFFVLTIGDYVRATGDDRPLKTYWPKIEAIYRRYLGFDREGISLPLKPRNDRDWADNVFRQGYVAYDLGLWIGVLDVIADLGKTVDPTLSAAAAADAAQARNALDGVLLQPGGWYADYGHPEDFIEPHLALDSLTLLRFSAVGEERAATILSAVEHQLETRHNADQPYGDWGVMCVWPPFSRSQDTRAKSAFAYRYHNGSDWPYLSAIYAEERLKRDLPGWDYPLLRWWRTSLEQGWIGSVEYFSPPFGRGSLLQGWTGMHAALLLAHPERIEAAIAAGQLAD